jgi:hypothetical protein
MAISHDGDGSRASDTGDAGDGVAVYVPSCGAEREPLCSARTQVVRKPVLTAEQHMHTD